MKIIVIHGDDSDKSYKRLNLFVDEAKKRSWLIQRIDSKQSIPEQIKAKDLFEKNSLKVIDNFDSLLKKDIDWLNKNQGVEITLVIYHPSLLTKTKLKSIKKIDKVEEYKLPVLLWKFMESFYPGNTTNCIKLLHNLTKAESVELVFALLVRQIRDLYLVTLDEPSDLPSWKVSKLRGQARHFKENQIKTIIEKMAEIDMKVKTSKANLKDELDFLIISQLE